MYVRELILSSLEFPTRRIVIIHNPRSRHTHVRFVGTTISGGEGDLVKTLDFGKFEQDHFRAIASFVRVRQKEVADLITRIFGSEV